MPAAELIRAARSLSRAASSLRFAPPVTHVYNPLDYAWEMHEAYLRRFATTHKRVVFVGMNPGPFGMMQTGVPFGEVAAVRDWMRLEAPIRRPAEEHPKRPIEGLACRRSEVSGQRLWGWAASRFVTPERFFEHAFVLNYCPLVFLADSGRNCTPDKLPAHELRPLQDACDAHLRAAISALRPQWTIAIGGWAARRIHAALGEHATKRVGQILHPSPASPMANRGWAEQADAQLAKLGVLRLLAPDATREPTKDGRGPAAPSAGAPD